MNTTVKGYTNTCCRTFRTGIEDGRQGFPRRDHVLYEQVYVKAYHEGYNIGLYMAGMESRKLIEPELPTEEEADSP